MRLCDCGHTLAARSEGETDESLFRAHVLLLDVLDLYISTVEHVNHGKIGGSAVVGNVAADGSAEQFLGLFCKSELFKLDLGLPGVNWNLNVTASPHTYDLHLVVGEGTCLIGADVVSATHNLTRCKLLDITVILEHCTD